MNQYNFKKINVLKDLGSRKSYVHQQPNNLKHFQSFFNHFKVVFDHFEVNSFSKKKSPPVVVEQAELAQPTNQPMQRCC